VNHSTVLAGIDLPLIFRNIAGIKIPDGAAFDGENLSGTITGNENLSRQESLFWIRPPDRPGYDGNNDPDLAIRKGEYNPAMDVDASHVQLYNIINDREEKMYLALYNPYIAKGRIREFFALYENYPHDIIRFI